ncbi:MULTISPECIES: hypothetical protein [Priestia]|uniref:hypothetical protein n=1 Tax=Priestia TaxID=2800373 RepID=UPI000BFBE502|nr:hypothetical protein [Priestia aryabhattai]PHF72956.1 hypothetical protein COI42_15350 [Priestia aryabhattai]
MIGGQGEDSCGESGTDETPQGGSSATRAKRRLARKLTAVSQAVQLMHTICLSLYWINLVKPQLLLNFSSHFLS